MDRTVEHNGTKFGKLTRRQRTEMTRPLQTEARAKVDANLKAGGVTGGELADRLDDFDFNERALGARLFGAYVLSDEGTDDVLLRGLRNVNPSASLDDLDKLDIDDQDAVELVLKLCNMRLKAPDDAGETDGEAEKEPDPTSHACYGDSPKTGQPPTAKS